jgi:dTDP-4-dehydrorhamnose reductase
MSGSTQRPPTAVLIGADGMLGRAMVAELKHRGWGCIAPSRNELDLARAETIAAFMRRANHEFDPAPTVVINCAAWTDVDGAETHEAEATAVNAHAIGALLAACGDRCTLITYSTDYVFDGQNTAPYLVDQPRAPLNAYGRSKAAGEAILESARSPSWLNIRTSWLYAPWGRNFVLTMRKLVAEKPQLKVVNDQRSRPTSAEHLARTNLALFEAGARGHQHVSDGGECTWHEFTCEIKRLTGGAAEVLPCTSSEFPRPARRPAYSVLDLSRTEAIVGPMPPWKENLAGVLARAAP